MMEYVIYRSDEDYLAHHGIKGQKWGVRRFENADGTLTEAGKIRYAKKVDRAFQQESKKLTKLENNADTDLQRAKANTYSRQSKKLAKAAAVAGGLAAVSGVGIRKAVPLIGSKVYNNIIKKYKPSSGASLEEMSYDATQKAKFEDRMTRDLEGKIAVAESEAKMYFDRARAYGQQGKYKESYNADGVAKYYKDEARRMSNDLFDQKKKLRNATDEAEKYETLLTNREKEFNEVGKVSSKTLNASTIAAYALGGTAIALGAAAGTRAIQSSIAKKRASELGHEKAVQKYEAHVEDMLKQFGGTKYESVIRERVNAYREAHPNTRMNSKQIEQMLNSGQG